MRQEKILMGMTIRIEIADLYVKEEIFDKIFSYFEKIDAKFSTYKESSEISKINSGSKSNYSQEMQEIFALAEETKKNTGGYFDILTPDGKIDPSGIVKGWAIQKASDILKNGGYNNFYIDAGGDIQVCGKNKNSKPWRVGIRNPLKPAEIVKTLSVEEKGVATSGTYLRGQHIYSPRPTERSFGQAVNSNMVSLTVIGPNIYEADRFATAAFAMGSKGIYFIENLPGFEGYMIDQNGMATMTKEFEKYCA